MPTHQATNVLQQDQAGQSHTQELDDVHDELALLDVDALVEPCCRKGWAWEPSHSQVRPSMECHCPLVVSVQHVGKPPSSMSLRLVDAQAAPPEGLHAGVNVG